MGLDAMRFQDLSAILLGLAKFPQSRVNIYGMLVNACSAAKRLRAQGLIALK